MFKTNTQASTTTAPKLFRDRVTILGSTTSNDGAVWSLCAKLKSHSPVTVSNRSDRSKYKYLNFNFFITRQGDWQAGVIDPLKGSDLLRDLTFHGRTNQVGHKPIRLRPTFDSATLAIAEAGEAMLIENLTTASSTALDFLAARSAYHFLKAGFDPEIYNQPIHLLNAAIAWLALRLQVLACKNKQLSSFALQLLSLPQDVDASELPPTLQELLQTARAVLL